MIIFKILIYIVKNSISATADSECVLNSPRLIDCYDIVEMKERLIRKKEALEFAIEAYISEGIVTPDGTDSENFNSELFKYE